MQERIIKLLKDVGIPVVLVIIVIALVLVIRNYYSTKLTILQIQSLERDLGIT